jgi:hypothetical protein
VGRSGGFLCSCADALPLLSLLDKVRVIVLRFQPPFYSIIIFKAIGETQYFCEEKFFKSFRTNKMFLTQMGVVGNVFDHLPNSLLNL